MKKLTSMRRKVLQNIADGKQPYDGIDGSQLGGVIRSIQTMEGILGLVAIDDGPASEDGSTRYVLTAKGKEALRTGRYNERPL